MFVCFFLILGITEFKTTPMEKDMLNAPTFCVNQGSLVTMTNMRHMIQPSVPLDGLSDHVRTHNWKMSLQILTQGVYNLSVQKLL